LKTGTQTDKTGRVMNHLTFYLYRGIATPAKAGMAIEGNKPQVEAQRGRILSAGTCR
jgi:hypothetical protein